MVSSQLYRRNDHCTPIFTFGKLIFITKSLIVQDLGIPISDWNDQSVVVLVPKQVTDTYGLKIQEKSTYIRY